jgi:predicted DNA-binding transcriptional regulator AlpA
MPDRPPQPAELLDADAAAGVAGISRRLWLQLVSKDEAPAPVVLPVRRLTRWRRGDVLRWIEELPTRT